MLQTFRTSLTHFLKPTDKLKVSTDIKKSQEPGIANPLSIGGYNNMYGQFYQPSPFFQPPDNQSTKALTQPPGPTGSLDYNKSKEHSPLDLMNKLQPSKNTPNETSSSSSNPVNPNNVGKMMHYQHYPYKYDNEYLTMLQMLTLHFLQFYSTELSVQSREQLWIDAVDICGRQQTTTRPSH